MLRVAPDPDYESTSSANDDESENKGNEKGTQISKKNVNYIRHFKNHGLRKS